MCPSTRCLRSQCKWYGWYITPTATGTGGRRWPQGTRLTLPRCSEFLLDHDVCDMRTKLHVRNMLCQGGIMKQIVLALKSYLMRRAKAITRTPDLTSIELYNKYTKLLQTIKLVYYACCYRLLRWFSYSVSNIFYINVKKKLWKCTFRGTVLYLNIFWNVIYSCDGKAEYSAAITPDFNVTILQKSFYNTDLVLIRLCSMYVCIYFPF